MASGRVFEALDLASFHLQSKIQGSKSLPDLIQLDKDLTAKLKDCGFLLDSSTNMKDTSIEPVKKPDKTPLKVGGKPIDKLKVPQLKTDLGKRKLSTTGNKAELVERLQKSILDLSSDRNISRQNLNLNVNGSQEVQRNHHTEAKDKQDDEIILVGTKPQPCPSHSYFHDLFNRLERELVDIKKHLKLTESSTGRSTHKLEEENNSLREHLKSSQQKLQQVTEERDSLKLVVSILSKDLYHSSQKDSSSGHTRHNQPKSFNDPLEPEQQWQTVGKTKGQTSANKRKNNSSKTPKKTNANANDSEITPVEQFTTLLIGDAMVQNVQGIKIGKAVGHRVVVCSISRATTNAMKDYLKPNLEPNPDEVVLHVGTNDLRTKSPQEVADGIVDLGRQVEGSSDARVVISALVSRRDKLNEKVPEVNKLLKRYCRQHEWKLIEHNNITEKGLNKGGLHLSIEGNKRFFNNFCDSLSTH